MVSKQTNQKTEGELPVSIIRQENLFSINELFVMEPPQHPQQYDTVLSIIAE